MDNEPDSPLSEFWRFASAFRSLSLWIATTVIAAPLLDLAIGVGPPWPSRTANAAFLTIVVGFVVMYAFEFWRKRSRRVGRRAFIGGLVIAAIFFVVYLYISAFYIEDSDNQGGREIIGYTMHGTVQPMVDANPSKWTHKELLVQFHDPTEVWTRSSVITMRFILLLLWLAMWIAIAVGMAAFVSLRWNEADAAVKKNQSKSTP